jgi:uncharacterized protein (TIGR02118 family)
MIKVMWLVKRAEHLSRDEFAKWWTDVHAPQITAEQVPRLVRYVVNVALDDDLPAKPDSEPDWDGVAEEWFPTEAAFAECYGKTNEAAHDDFVAHTSRAQRLVVREITFVS